MCLIPVQRRPFTSLYTRSSAFSECCSTFAADGVYYSWICVCYGAGKVANVEEVIHSNTHTHTLHTKVDHTSSSGYILGYPYSSVSGSNMFIYPLSIDQSGGQIIQSHADGCVLMLWQLLARLCHAHTSCIKSMHTSHFIGPQLCPSSPSHTCTNTQTLWMWKKACIFNNGYNLTQREHVTAK